MTEYPDGWLTNLSKYIGRLNEELEKAKAENADLRELLHDYYNAPCVDCRPWDEDWHGCKHCDGGNCMLATRAIEMGVG